LGDVFGAKAGALTDPMEHAVLALCLERIATDAAAVEWEFYPPGDSEEPIEDHPVDELWEKPNRFMRGNQLWYASYLSKLIFGEWFWYYPDLVLSSQTGPARKLSSAGTPNQINLLDPRCVKDRVEEDGTISWSWEVNGVSRPLDSARLTQSKRWNQNNPVRGRSLIAAVLPEAEADQFVMQWNKRFFGEQNGIPAGLLIPGVGSNLDADQRKELKRTWAQHAEKRSIAVLPGPGWDFKDLSTSQREMDFLGMRTGARELILAACGVPPLVAGFLDTTIKYNAREQKEIYWQNTIYPLVEQDQSVINADFLPSIGIADEVYPKWEAVKAMLTDMTERANTAKILFDMGVPFAQINERLELGFDAEQIPGSEVGYLPIGLLPADMSGARTVAGPVAEPTQDQADAQQQDGTQPQKSLPAFREERRALIWRNLIVRTRDLEDQFDRVIRGHFKAIEYEVMANLANLKGFLMVQTKEVARYLFDLDAAKKKLRKTTEPVYKQIAKRGGDSLAAELGGLISFNVNDPVVLASIAQLTHRIARIDETVERALRESLGEGLRASETISELRDRVRGVMEVSLGRSRTIARTETGMSFNLSRNIGMKQAGITQQEWLSARDADVRDTHAAIDGDTTHIGEPFANGLLYPQDPSGPAKEVINCRCVALPVVE
jgi:SPP1 gp7 family putative phage head morphogenesis protein